MSMFDRSYLGVMVDMAGCPNRCRHCWLSAHKNGNRSVEDFKDIAAGFKGWRDENGRGIEELSFFSWWREPDFRSDYRELWRLEQELSSPGRAERFELLSTWRLARDASYAEWAATLEPKTCQITFFGMEETTDWGMRRKGAFRDQLKATERCREVGITPRWQLFLTKRCLPELPDFLRLMQEYQITSFFIGGMSPEGCGYELESERLEQADLQQIPDELVALSRDGLANLGQSECELLPNLMQIHTPIQNRAAVPCIAIDAEDNVYPNIAEPTEWWCLGNLKKDGIDSIMKAYREGSTPGMRVNESVPVCELAKQFGDPVSSRLYAQDDLLCRFLHQWGETFMEESR